MMKIRHSATKLTKYCFFIIIGGFFIFSQLIEKNITSQSTIKDVTIEIHDTPRKDVIDFDEYTNDSEKDELDEEFDELMDAKFYDMSAEIPTGRTKENKLPYKILLNEPNFCKIHKPFIINIIPIAVQDTKSRGIIRKMWMQPKIQNETGLYTLFIVGKLSEENTTFTKLLKKESEIYNDIIQVDIQEKYENLVIKILTIFYWKNTYCKNVKWLLKSDNDVVVNPFKLKDILSISATDFVCRMNTHILVCRVGRCKFSKWHVSRDEYSEDYYPPYCKGPAYIVSANMSQNLYSVANKTNPLFIEDAYFTGVLPQQFHPTYTKLNEVFLLKVKHGFLQVNIYNTAFIWCDNKKKKTRAKFIHAWNALFKK